MGKPGRTTFRLGQVWGTSSDQFCHQNRRDKIAGPRARRTHLRGVNVSGTNLTRDEAQARAALIETTSYEVALDVTTSPETFASTTTVCFTATTPGTETFIDLIAPRVDTITLNGRPLDPASHFDGVRVRLPGLEADNVRS